MRIALWIARIAPLAASFALACLMPNAAWSAGPAVGWGDNEYEQAKVPGGLDGAEGKATAISVGWDGACAIRAGTAEVVCWQSIGRHFTPDAVNGAMHFHAYVFRNKSTEISSDNVSWKTFKNVANGAICGENFQLIGNHYPFKG